MVIGLEVIWTAEFSTVPGQGFRGEEAQKVPQTIWLNDSTGIGYQGGISLPRAWRTLL